MKIILITRENLLDQLDDEKKLNIGLTKEISKFIEKLNKSNQEIQLLEHSLNLWHQFISNSLSTVDHDVQALIEQNKTFPFDKPTYFILLNIANTISYLVKSYSVPPSINSMESENTNNMKRKSKGK